MKKIFTLLTIACMVFTGCTDDDLFGKKGGYAPAKPGDEIVFGGSMTYKSAKKSGHTRTVYGDKVETGTEIKWLAGDKVRIYCDQAYVDPTNPADVKYCDYSVTGAFSGAGQITGNGDDTAYETCSLEKYSAVGLRWGEASVDGHYFFGVYPSPEQFDESQDLDAKNKLEIKAEGEGKVGKLTAYLPSLQYPARYVAKSDNTYTMHPAMRYAYMVGAAKANPSDGGVDMLFVPVVAAVEMTLVNNGESTVEDIDMITLTSTEGKAIAGNFTTTIAMDTNGVTDIANSVNDNAETSDEYKSVSVPVYQLITNTDGSTTTTTVDLAKGESIKFTVFMLLDGEEALNSLKVSLRAGGITKAATVSGVKIVQAKKKNFLNGVGVSIKNQITLDYSNWMSQLGQAYDEETATISPLSVPGAGGAWSGTKKTSDNSYSVPESYRQQNLSFDELWDCGIRCFEMQVDDNFNLHCNTKSISDEDGTALTFDEAMTDVITKVKNTKVSDKSTEFAFVIVTYSNTDGVNDRNSGAYQSTLSSKVNTLNTSNDNIIIPWEPGTTINDARGHVFVISRPGSIGVDYGWQGLGTGNANILSILGWGSMPDQWYARGFGNLQNFYSDCYTTKDNAILGTGTRTYTLIADALDLYDKNTINTLTGLRPFTMTSWENEQEAEYSSGSWTYESQTTTSNFGYYAVSSSKDRYGGLRSSLINRVWDGQNAWVQEWKRVVAEDITAEITNSDGDGNQYTYTWKSNIDEKWDDIVETLSLSMEDMKREDYSYYINSLCGYFVSPNISESCIPALNVQRYGVETATGSMIIGAIDDNNIENKIFCDDKYQSLITTSVLEVIYSSCNFSVTNWGPYSPNAGLAGDVATYASWVNGKFYSHLQGLMTSGGGLGGDPTGIVLMDRVSNTTDNMAGLNIARIIIANNFENTNTAEGASVMRISLDEEEVNSDNSDDYKFAAPEKR